MSERKHICEMAEKMHLPKTTVAVVAEVANSAVTAYFHGTQLSGVTARKIERAILDISVMVEKIYEQVGLPLPLDFGNAVAIKSGVNGLRRATDEYNRALETAEKQVQDVFDTLLQGTTAEELQLPSSDLKEVLES